MSLVCMLLMVPACGGDAPPASEETAITTTTRPAAFDAPQGRTSGKISIERPPPEGTYTFVQEGTTHVLDQGTDPKPIPRHGTLEVAAPQERPEGFFQVQKHLDGSGDRIEQTLLYAPDGLFLVGYETDVSVAGSKRSFVCKPARPVRIFPNGAGAGDTWEDRVDCENGQIHYRAVAEAEEDTALADGSTLPTLRVRVENTIDGEGLSTSSTYVLWVSWQLGISVRTDDSTDAQLSVYEIERRVQDLLVSATPG